MSTRIIIKNLPHDITSQRLKAHFSSSQSGPTFFSGQITDAKLVTDPKSGKFRGFAFVGYRNPEQAEKAVEWFNGTFLDQRKISVEVAKPAGDQSLGPSWREKNKEYALRQKHKDEKGTEISKKRKREAVEDEERGTAIEDSTRPRRNGKLLAQNTVLEKAQNAPLAHEVKSLREEKSKKRKKTKEGEGNKKKLPAEESTSVVEVVYDDSAPQVVEDEPEAEKPPMTDQEWLRARTSRTLGLVSDSEDSDAEHDWQSDNESIASEEPEEQSEETTLVTPPATSPSETAPQPSQNASTAESKILKTGRLFIRNLVYGITEADLREIFSQYGPLVEVHVPLGKNQEPLPFGFVLFEVPSDAVKAFKELDGTDLQGRLMHIIPGDEKRVSKEDDEEGKTLKQRREIERRKQAGRGSDWGTLFMNQDAVLSSLASRYGISKSDLLLNGDASSADPAVKAAMAETTILTETKVYLIENGINLSSLSTSQNSRSDHVIIAKNFPYGTTRDELVHLFGGTEIVKRVLLPPAGTIAFVEFFDSGQCRAAFTRLAYRRFKDVPLYLEKAPAGIFETEPSTQLSGVEAKKGSKDLVPTDVEEPGATLYIKNLDFSTTQAGLTNAFKGFPGFRLAVLKVKPPNSKGERLSMGFGFATFESKEMATAAMTAGVVLDGRKLEMKFARQGTTEIKPATKLPGGRKKIAIKNLGFAVTKKDLRELFGTYGHIQSLRLPKKFDNTPRGFAFIEFTTASDARNAMESLKHTHLLGRHLVLDWAEEDDGGGLENMRGRVREGVQAGEVGKMMGLASAGGRVADIPEDE